MILLELLLCTLFIFVLVSGQTNNSEEGDNVGSGRRKLHLVNVLPFPNGRADSGWDRAYELIPAAELAVKHINNANNSTFLEGYQLELVSVESEPCGVSTGLEGLVNTFANVLYPNTMNVVGLSGLFCSSVTGVLAPIFSFPNITYVQLSGSTNPIHHDSLKFPWLINLISSSAVLNDAVLALMNTFDWQSIGLIHESLNSGFSKAVAQDFLDRDIFSTEFNLPTVIPVTINSSPNLAQVEAKIILFIGSAVEAVRFLCAAYQQNARYPDYVYIFQSRSLLDYVSNANFTYCTQDQIKDVIEGVIIVEYGLVSENTSRLVSNMSYAEYYQEYNIRLLEMELTRNITLDKNNIYSNSMYDELWAFALALKASFGELEGIIDLNNLSRVQTGQFANIIRDNLLKVSFQGASGFVQFDKNRDIGSDVNIYQVINTSMEQIGEYVNNSLILLRNISLPNDRFETVIHFLPRRLIIALDVINVFCLIFITLIFVFMLIFRNRPEVKSSSPYLNILIFAGGYMVFFAAGVRTLTRGYPFPSDTSFTFACNVEVWFGSLGTNLIFSTLFVRLLRVWRIFKSFEKLSKYWRDGYLIIIILLMCSGGLIILIVWTITDTIRKTPIKELIQSTPPYFEIQFICSSDQLGLWLAAAFSYVGLIVFIVVIMAILTRKIKRRNFKDTKKVNAYVIFMFIKLSILMPLWYVVDRIAGNESCRTYPYFYSFITVGLFSQLFLFLPQVYITLLNIIIERFGGNFGIPLYRTKRRDTQFSS